MSRARIELIEPPTGHVAGRKNQRTGALSNLITWTRPSVHSGSACQVSSSTGASQTSAHDALYGLRAPTWVAAIGVGLIAVSALVLSPAVPYPSVYALLPTLGTAAALTATGAVARFLSQPVLHGIGRRSYG